MRRAPSGPRLTLALCIAEIMAMSTFASFPALTPFFFDHWNLSGEDAGWINAAFFFGFTLVGPLSTSLTDRIDARGVFLAGCLMALIGAYGFAFHADDFFSALPWRFIAGAGLGCTYMPGLKLLTDRLPPGDQSRAIAFYTASFSTGSAVSFLLVGQVNLWLGWELALISAIAGPPIAIAIILLSTSRKLMDTRRPWSQIFNYMPVLSNRFSMGYILAYICHTWELVAMRSFMLAFLAYSHSLTEAPAWMDVSVITAAAVFLGLPSSVLGNELSLRIGRQRSINYGWCSRECARRSSRGDNGRAQLSWFRRWYDRSRCCRYRSGSGRRAGVHDGLGPDVHFHGSDHLAGTIRIAPDTQLI